MEPPPSSSSSDVGVVVEETAVSMLRKLFDAIDVNSNGAIDRGEFMAALNETHTAASGRLKPTSRSRQLRLTLTQNGADISNEHLFEILDGDNSGTQAAHRSQRSGISW